MRPAAAGSTPPVAVIVQINSYVYRPAVSVVGLEKMPCKMPSAIIVSPEPTVIVSTAVPAELVTIREKVSLVMSISDPVRRSLNVN